MKLFGNEKRNQNQCCCGENCIVKKQCKIQKIRTRARIKILGSGS